MPKFWHCARSSIDVILNADRFAMPPWQFRDQAENLMPKPASHAPHPTRAGITRSVDKLLAGAKWRHPDLDAEARLGRHGWAVGLSASGAPRGPVPTPRLCRGTRAGYANVLYANCLYNGASSPVSVPTSQGSVTTAWSVTGLLGLAALVYGLLRLRARQCAAV